MIHKMASQTEDEQLNGENGEDEEISNKQNDQGQQDVKTKTEWTPEALQRLLADAITYKSSLDDIKVIVRCGAKVNVTVKKGLFPLHYASYVNYADCVTFLIENGAGINVVDDIGYTPLHLCARRGFTASMTILINNGALLNYCDSADDDVDASLKTLGYLTYEPLNMAIENNHVGCVRLLLENGANPNNKYFMGHEVNLVPLENKECLELLLKHGANPNVFNRCGLTPLMKACRENKENAVHLLLDHGADVNLICPPRFDQKTALHFAIQSGNVSVIKSLLRNGAKLSVHGDFKYSPLHAAVLSDNGQVCRLLLEHGANVDERTEDNTTSLMLACATPGLKQRLQITKALLDHGADANAHSDFVSYTDPFLSPLAEYLKNSGDTIDSDVVQVLVSHGARVTFCDDMTMFRLKDPYGILNYFSKLKTNNDLCQFLLNAASVYDMAAIRRTSMLLPVDKRQLEEYGNSPRELKHVVRLSLRNNLKVSLPSRVQSLPLPSLIKSYLLFEH